MTLETSPESPVPVRTVLQLVAGWINRLGRVWVEGQVTEVSQRGATVFLTLRDPVADVSVRVVCSRQVYDAVPPLNDGARVLVWAKPDFWVNRGSFALTALEVRPVGIGELLARLERLRRSLTEEGLFDPKRKRPLPFLPHTVGLICGRSSAAERDVLQNARARWPGVRFRVEEVAVQGPYAAAEVIDALTHLDGDAEVDVIVIARGGGSVEDLLPFSDESLLRAVAACRTPVVSAIGHEQDAPLLDHVADVRASTPTDAAKKVVPDIREEWTRVSELRDRARRRLAIFLDHESARLSALRSRPAFADPERELARYAEQIIALRERLRALSPGDTLRRGYAVVQDPTGRVVRSAAEVSPGDELSVRFADSRISVIARDHEADRSGQV
jgi:exodeoxyribonuclease VII large subunit